MSRLSVFAAAVVLSALTTTPVVFAKQRHHVRKTPQLASEQVCNAHAAVITPPERTTWHLLGQSML